MDSPQSAAPTPGAFENPLRPTTPDPGVAETSAYEQARNARTLAALARERYYNALELGCSGGVLTRQLAVRCEHLLATDPHEAVLVHAYERTRDLLNVELGHAGAPAEAPTDRGLFDLIVASEVLFHLSWEDLRAAREQLINALAPGGHLLLVHWTPFVRDYPLSGDEAHTAFLLHTGEGQPLRHLHHERHDTFRLDLLERVE